MEIYLFVDFFFLLLNTALQMGYRHILTGFGILTIPLSCQQE